MGGVTAENCSEISHDPASLDKEGFWAIQIDFEGRPTFARFEDVSFNFDFESEQSVLPPAGPWVSSMTKSEYISYVERAREAIANGDIYQVNACRVLSAPHEGSLEGLFGAILAGNPAPFASYLRLPKIEIASASPELFIEICEDHEGRSVIKSSPIKGTARENSFAEKDYPENLMIVDLMRNDFGSITEVGSIEVPRLFGVEEHPGLFHLVSDVTGILKAGITWQEIFDALLPAGSISGAPKSSATKLIAANEMYRGPYCGVLGWVYDGMAVLSVGIRLFWKSDGQIHFGTGAGITWGSVAEKEWEETELKAARLMKIAQGESV